MSGLKERTASQSVEDWLYDYTKGDSEVDMSKYGQAASDDLKAADFKGKKFKGTIATVTTRTYPARDDQQEDTKAVLTFEEPDLQGKPLVVSHPNAQELLDWYGSDSAKWVGKTIGMSTKTWNVGEGWVFTQLDAKPEDFDDEIPFS